MPRQPRRVYVVRRVVAGLVAAVVLSAGIYLPLTLLAPLDPVTARILPVAVPDAAAVEPVLPGYGAAAIGAVGFEGVLASSGDDQPHPIASITKVITALVALEAMPLRPGETGPVREMTARDEDYYWAQLYDGGSVVSAWAGLELSQLDVLRLVLMESANNYAQTLADWAFGSESAFLEAARAWLDARGLQVTTIVEPTGVDPGNVSTTSELVQLGRLALAHPVIAEIVATAAVELAPFGLLENSNELLGIDGVDGIKTGTLDEAGSCLLFATDVLVGDHSITVVGVVLGGPDHDTINAHIRELLASVVPGFQELQLVEAGTPVARYETIWGDSAVASTAQSASVLVWSQTPVAALVASRELTVAERGEQVGSLDFQVGGSTISVPLVLEQPIEDPGPWWRLLNPALLF